MTSPSTCAPTRGARAGNDRLWHLGFGLLLVVGVLGFSAWAMGYVGPGATIALLLLTIAFGCFMAFNIGGNDVANSFGTSVGAGTLTLKQALVIAAVFEVAGAVLAGGSVTDTVRSGIVDLGGIDLEPIRFAYIMMAALLGAALWLLFATWRGWPVSTTHSIIGGIIGAAVALGLTSGTGGLDMVQWSQIGEIAISWILSPLLGGIVSWSLYSWIKRSILSYNDRANAQLEEIDRERRAHSQRHRERFDQLTALQQASYTGSIARDAVAIRLPEFEPGQLESDFYKELFELDRRAESVNAHRALERWVPVLAAIGSMIVAAMVVFKGLRNVDIGLNAGGSVMVILMIGVLVWMAIFTLARSLRKLALPRSTFLIFSWMQVFTAAAFAFSHGSNDIANAIGPFAAVLDVLKTGEVGEKAVVPAALTVVCGIALVSGLWFIGRNVIKTVGSGLTEIHPASGFTAELAAASVVMLASAFGLPVSSTHILIGAVLGIGVANRAANWRLMRPIATAWVITLPASAAASALIAVGLDAIF
ncbi:inorganic phosphate transporter [Actinomyces sp. B33]|uniref:inorganic phosphate transporter n=1 Tax=Actinomyces sp. B33 TaxID=2942131 RepID=UPI0023400500|nr:inorganic phosphate transporter [Actinomyces sp. B33]MDC4232384.1 inorganic phosphate transporter [Actinomyces sp. B33]